MTGPVWAAVQSQRYRVFINPIEFYCSAGIDKYFGFGFCDFAISLHLSYEFLVSFTLKIYIFFSE
jgi:hypothetical protein